MLKDTNTTDLGIIIDTANLFSRQAKQEADILAEIFRQSGKEEATNATKEGG